MLHTILARRGGLNAVAAVDGAPLVPGQLVVAPPRRHLLVQDGRVRLSLGPRENRHRPAIDPLFRSAARFGRSRVIAIVLSGVLDDGVAGAAVVRRAGGVVIAQDPNDAEFGTLPLRAIAEGVVEHVLPVAEIPPMLERLLAEESSPSGESVEDLTAAENTPAEARQEVESAKEEMLGAPSALTCPECSGSLWEVRAGQLVRYECRIAHRFSPLSLAAAQDESIESALWTAYRALEEKASITRRLWEGARERGLGELASHYEDEHEATVLHAAALRRIIDGV